MKKIIILAALLSFVIPYALKAVPKFTGKAAVFFERGHYWIELGLASGSDGFR